MTSQFPAFVRKSYKAHQPSKIATAPFLCPMHKNGAGFIMLTIPSVDKNPRRFGRAALLYNRQEPEARQRGVCSERLLASRRQDYSMRCF